MDKVEPLLGAVFLSDGRTQFCVWVPLADRVELRILGPSERLIAMLPSGGGYFSTTLDDAPPGTRYHYRLNGTLDRPDPASRYQPEGVHGPSEVVDSRFDWTDAQWRGISLSDFAIYELHVGTFTSTGTFSGVVDRLDDLKQLGITAIELMPVAQFSGSRNWGYDGVFLFAPQNSYGGPRELKTLIDACHERGLAVVLDVVHNHVGPEGNYLAEFGPYFTDRHRTPWGQGLDFDGTNAAAVRRFFIDSALHWITEFHVDALRLDAVDAIVDTSAAHFLADLATAIEQRGLELGRKVHTFAESHRNDPILNEPREAGGYGLSAQWLDDFERSMHVLLTGERDGHYAQYGSLDDLASAFRDGFVRRRPGVAVRNVEPQQLIAFTQTHDVVGNRLKGDRLSELVGFDALKLAAATVILGPWMPLLFMGEEYAEPAPFLYFISHQNPRLIAGVRRGRRREFKAFGWSSEPSDPQAVSTFENSRLNWPIRNTGRHGVLLRFYQELLRLRRETAALRTTPRDQTLTLAFEEFLTIAFFRRQPDGDLCLLLNLGRGAVNLPTLAPELRDVADWRVLLDLADPRWADPALKEPQQATAAPAVLTPHSCRLLAATG